MEDRIATRPQDYSSLVLRDIVSRLRSPRRKTVLDLGPPSGDNLQFFAARGCKFFIADFFDSLLNEYTKTQRPFLKKDQIRDLLILNNETWWLMNTAVVP